MNFLLNQSVGELDQGDLNDLEHSSGDEDWTLQPVDLNDIASDERILEQDMEIEEETKNELAQQYFSKPYDKLEKKQKFLCDLHCELDDLETVVDKSYLPNPTDRRMCFFTQEMAVKLDEIYTQFSGDMAKITIDMTHKPLFWDLSPDFKLTRNGKVYQHYISEGGLSAHDQDDYETRKKQEKSLIRNYVYEVFHDETHSLTALLIYLIIVLSIITSVIATIMQTTPSMQKYDYEFKVTEAVVTICFTIEYISKLIVVRNRCKYAIRPMNILDLLAILPFYMQLTLGNLNSFETIGGVLRALRLTRIAKIRQLATPYTNIIMQAMVDSLKGTGSAVGIFLFIGTVMMGTLVFAAEKKQDSGFISIPMGMWFAMVTITTVGYGDYSPTSTVGYMLGTVCIMFGLILTSLIIMVIGQYYMIHLDEYMTKKEQIKVLLYESSEDFATYTPDDRMNAFKYLMTNFNSKYMYGLIKGRLRRWEEAKNQSKDFALARKHDTRRKSPGLAGCIIS